jgi:hypothetical protein
VKHKSKKDLFQNLAVFANFTLSTKIKGQFQKNKTKNQLDVKFFSAFISYCFFIKIFFGAFLLQKERLMFLLAL